MEKNDIPRRWVRDAVPIPKTYDLTPSPSDKLEQAAIENAIFRLTLADLPFGPKRLVIPDPPSSGWPLEDSIACCHVTLAEVEETYGTEH